MTKIKPFSLSKYPISTEMGEYKVDLDYGEGAYGSRYLCTYVYIIRENKKWFQRKFKRVFKYEKEDLFTKREEFEQWMANYVDFAKRAIELYEIGLLIEARDKKKHNEAIEEFNNWDGQITKA